MVSRKKLCAAAAFALCALILSGCSAASLLAGGADDLLRAPTLNAQQAEVSQALRSTLNLEDIIYRHPLRGSAPVVFRDLDGDGVDEAIVFYSLSARPSEIWVKILRRDGDGAWASYYDIPGSGDQIEFIEFANLTSLSLPCMLLGWMNSARQERYIEIYVMSDIGFERQYSGSYAAYTVASGSGLPRLLLAAQERRNAPFELRLLGGVGGRLYNLAQMRLDEDAGEILRMQQSVLWDNSRAIILDVQLDRGTVGTEIIRYTPSALQLVAGGALGEDSPEKSYFLETFRPEPELSLDIDGKGFVMIPFLLPLPGIEEHDELEPLRMTVFYRPTENGLAEDRSAVVDHSGGYLLFFPERWLGSVTVADNPEANQRSFHIYDQRTQLLGQELLRIAAYSGYDYSEEPGGYFLLAERSAMRYYAYLPELEGEPLALGREELEELFSLI